MYHNVADNVFQSSPQQNSAQPIASLSLGARDQLPGHAISNLEVLRMVWVECYESELALLDGL